MSKQQAKADQAAAGDKADEQVEEQAEQVEELEKKADEPGSFQVGALKFERAGSQDAQHIFKGLLFGQSGSGKSWLAASARKPFVLLTEENGRQSIRKSNPDAVIVRVDSFAGVRDFIAMAARDKLREHGCQTVVLDSLTEIQRLMKDEIMTGRPPGEGMTLQDWGELTERMRRMMRTIRNLPYDTVCVALDAFSEEENGPRYVYPSFEGKKLHNEVVQYFNFAAYVFKRERTSGANGEKTIEHAAMLEGPSRYLVKPCAPLTGIQRGPMSDWFDTLREG